MLELERRYQTRVFLFQDDDFPLWGAVGRRWASELCARMQESGLSERAIWKISCRAEYVEDGLFSMLREAGLFLVYMGIESGTEAGLEVLHKQMTVKQNLAAVETLKRQGILLGYGFMLFDPSTTFESVRENIEFLRRIVGDGSSAAVFSRMLPYGGTPIRDQLRNEGRLRGDVTRPDYEFLDPRLGEFYHTLTRLTRPWIHGEGLSYQLNYILDEFYAVRRLVPGVEGVAAYAAALNSMARDSNERLFGLVEQVADAFECGDRPDVDADEIRAFCEKNIARLIDMRNGFVADNIYVLRDASLADRAAGGQVMAPQVH